MAEHASILLCSDLDRTLLPNGAQPESPQARPLFNALARHEALAIAYVSGRDLRLLQAAVQDYRLPVPDYAVGDVGTTIYEIHGDQWLACPEWRQHIAPDWNDAVPQDLADLFRDLDELTLQAPDQQGAFKLSFYTPAVIDQPALFDEMTQRLNRHGVRANLIWSIDESIDKGLLDILPASANKLHAIRFLMAHYDIKPSQAVFAGDSGNDLPVFTSDIPSIAVANTHPDVIANAQTELNRNDGLASFYVARGGFLGMNGNYAAGVLEGLSHYIEPVRDWLAHASAHLNS